MSFEPFSDDDLEVSQEALLELGRLIQRYIQRQSRELHVDANGRPLPKGVDLYSSGRLLYQDVEFSVDTLKGLVTLVFSAPYASNVAERIDFAGVCPQLMPEFLLEAEPIIIKGVRSASGSSIGGSSGSIPDLDF